MAKKQKTSINTTGGAVRMTSAKSTRVKVKPGEVAVVAIDTVTPKSVVGFLDFIREHAVVGLAIGLVVGTQLKAIVDALNAGFINQLFALLMDGNALNQQTLTVHWRGRTAELGWGAVVYQIIDFIFIMAVIYAIIKLLHLDKIDKPKPKK